MGSPAILFSHLKNDSFLIFSRTWCIRSWNTALIVYAPADLDYPAKSLLGRLLLLNRSDLKSLLSWGIIFALPLPDCCSYSTLLYLSIWFMSWRKLVTGFPIRDFLKPCSAGRPLLKVLMATSSNYPLSHCTSPSICLSRLSGSPLLAWTKIIENPKAEEPCCTWWSKS